MPGADFWIGLKDWNGPQLVVAVAVVAIFVLFGAVRYFFVGGKPRFEAAREDRRDAITILQTQLAEVQGKLRAFEEREDKRAAEERDREDRRALEDGWNREYRHVLANQNHLLLANYDVTIFLIHDIAARWGDMPTDLRIRTERLKPPSELLKDIPLPPPLHDVQNIHPDPTQ